MAAGQITDQLVQEVADELRSRYLLDDDAMRALGVRLADVESLARHAENQHFAERFVSEHGATFHRLSQ